ncbi:hypothetical protein LXL04_002933 [Taraxacum kok-saghyz]
MNNNIINKISNPQYLRLLQKCSTMDHLKQIHAQTITIGLARFTYITSKLLAFSAMSDIDYAHTILNQITIPTIFDYNSTISGYSKTSKQEMGILLYNKMRNNRIEPNARTFPVLIKTCDCISSLLQVHGQAFKLGNISDVFVVSSLISMYSNFKAVELAIQVFEETSYKNVVCCTSLITGCFSNGLVDEACKVFDEMPERNDVSYSAMVSGFIKNELFNKAFEFFRQLKNGNLVKPNRSLLLTILTACGTIGALNIGQTIHLQLLKSSSVFDLEIGTSLIDFYAKCGDIKKALDIFTKMPSKDIATWTSMIMGLATNGENQTAINLFEVMQNKGPIPNEITFIAVLVACNHKSLSTKAWNLFGKMTKVFNIQPSIEHYGCMVHLLARSGDLKGAEILINLMPMGPDGAIWGSFLHGCLINSERSLAERAGKFLIGLDGGHSGGYVGVANMYAGIGRWEGVIGVRDMMVERKVGIAPGWSFIEVDGVVHKFFVDDKCHPRGKDIREVLNVLLTKYQ